MKTALLAILFLLLGSYVFADTNVTIAWDANSESGLAGYRVYKSQLSGGHAKGEEFASATVLAGEETATLSVPDGEWFFVVTAFDNRNNESGFSNEVTYIADSTPPSAPDNLRITITIVIDQ